jgi:predicted  nucleic acid-binding Zn-ribbon protein
MTPEKLLELQRTDSHIDLLRTRMPKLPEVVASVAADAEVAGWEREKATLGTRIAGYEAEITTSEQANEAIAKKRGRLEQQLKTVIAPREAEALMHEIALLNGQRSDLDDQELEAMDGLSQAEAALAEHAAKEAQIREAAAAAAATAASARAASEADIAESTVTRDALRAGFDAPTLARYDSMRAAHNGVAVAKLEGLRCDGCHLDLSRGEVDDIKRLPADEWVECSNCGRLLVR